MNNPTISVVMSVYNGARHLHEAIDSILSQTFADFEFLIIDDASTDNSPKILAQYAAADTRIRVITSEYNLGLTKNLNRAIREARGRYIARIDCDDVCLPERFARQVAYLDRHPQCGLVGLWANVIDDQGQYKRTIKHPTESAELKRVLIRYNPFFHPGLMMRREAILAVGLYDETFRFAQDYELCFRIAKKYDIANVPEVLLKYRESVGSITGSKNRKQVGFVLRAKLRALREGQYPKWNYIHLARTYIAWVLPVSVKRFLKRMRSMVE